MDHPAIVRVLAHDRDGEELYTVLEPIEGPDLCEPDGRVPDGCHRRVSAVTQREREQALAHDVLGPLRSR